jgi:hypothetical protein
MRSMVLSIQTLEVPNWVLSGETILINDFEAPIFRFAQYFKFFQRRIILEPLHSVLGIVFILTILQNDKLFHMYLKGRIKNIPT